MGENYVLKNNRI